MELADGKPPWINDHLMRVMYKIVHGTPPKFRDPSQWSDEFNDFLDQCLQKDPRARPSAKDLLSHPFIRTVCFLEFIFFIILKKKILFHPQKYFINSNDFKNIYITRKSRSQKKHPSNIWQKNINSKERMPQC